MTFKTKDGVGPPDWKLATVMLNGAGVAIMDVSGRLTPIDKHLKRSDASYWLACLINDGLGVGDNDDEVAS